MAGHRRVDGRRPPARYFRRLASPQFHCCLVPNPRERTHSWRSAFGQERAGGAACPHERARGEHHRHRRGRRRRNGRAYRSASGASPRSLAAGRGAYSAGGGVTAGGCRGAMRHRGLPDPVVVQFACDAGVADSAPVESPLFVRERAALLDALPALPGHIILISNEVGMGIVPLGPLSRRFCDEAGRLHQDLARVCDRVILTVAGLPSMLKGDRS